MTPTNLNDFNKDETLPNGNGGAGDDVVDGIIDEITGAFGDELSFNSNVLPTKEPLEFMIQNAALERTPGTNGKKSKKLLAAYCVVTDGEHKGKEYRKTWFLETQKNLDWFAGDLANLNVTPPRSAADLKRVTSDLIGVVFGATLVENADPKYAHNCYINPGAFVRREKVTSSAY